MKQITDIDISHFTATQINTLAREQIMSLTAEQINTLADSVLQGLSATVLSTLEQGVISALTANVLGKFSSDVWINSSNTRFLESLTSEQLNALNSDVVKIVPDSKRVQNGDFSRGVSANSTDATINESSLTTGTVALSEASAEDRSLDRKHGKFLLVSGAVSPEKSIWKQSVLMADNIDYQFSIDVKPGVRAPQLQLFANGQEISSIGELTPIEGSEWSQLTYSLTKPLSSGNLVTLEIKNQNAGGETSDFALDNVAVVSTGSINGKVWSADGGITGASVVLVDTLGKQIASSVTDKDGNYTFSHVKIGEYKVVFGQGSLEYKLGFVLPSDADETARSRVQFADGSTGTLNVLSGETLTGVDAGIVIPKGSIQGRIWLESLSDGKQDNAEFGYARFNVRLIAEDGSEQQVLTDKSGNYIFSNLAEGRYKIDLSPEVLPAGTRYTLQNAVGTDSTNDSDINSSGDTDWLTIRQGTQLKSIDVGIIPPIDPTSGVLPSSSNKLGIISGSIWFDSNGNGGKDLGEEMAFNNQAVRLLNEIGSVVATAQIGPQGDFTFNGLGKGIYYVDASDFAGYGFVRPHAAGIADDKSADIVLGDRLTVLGEPLPHGTTEMLMLTGETQTVPVNVGLTSSTWDAQWHEKSSISGAVWRDRNGNGVRNADDAPIAGVFVLLHNAQGVEVARTVTDSIGNYHFDGLAAGEYTVNFDGKTVPSWQDTQFSTTNPSGKPEFNTDVINAQGQTALINLATGSSIANIDAGISYLSEVNNNGVVLGTVTLSGTADGTIGSDAFGLYNVLVQLFKVNEDGSIASEPSAQTINTYTGFFALNGVKPGDYVAKFTPDAGTYSGLVPDLYYDASRVGISQSMVATADGYSTIIRVTAGQGSKIDANFVPRDRSIGEMLQKASQNALTDADVRWLSEIGSTQVGEASLDQIRKMQDNLDPNARTVSLLSFLTPDTIANVSDNALSALSVEQWRVIPLVALNSLSQERLGLRPDAAILTDGSFKSTQMTKQMVGWRNDYTFGLTADDAKDLGSSAVVVADTHNQTGQEGAGDAFLMINSAVDNSTAFWQQQTVLRSGAQYELSFWIKTDDDKPKLKLYIDGVAVAGEVDSTPSSEWRQVKFEFTRDIGAPSEASLALRNLNVEAAGNNFEIDSLAVNRVYSKVLIDAEVSALGSANDISDEQLRNLNTTQMALLPSSVISSLTSVQLNLISDAQWQSLTTEQRTQLGMSELRLGQTGHNLLVNGGFESRLSGWSTSYNVVEQTQQVGEIAIVSAAPNSGETEDSELRASGGLNFLLVAGKTENSNAFWSQQVDLADATSYKFSLRVAAHSNESAQLELHVDDQVLHPVAQTQVDKDWVDYTFDVARPVGSTLTAQLSLYNLNAHAVFGIDDIQLTQTHAHNFTNEEISALTPTQIASLDQYALVNLNKEQIGLLSTPQVAAFTIKQLQIFNANQLSGFSDGQRAQLPPFDLLGIATYSREQISSLTIAQVHSLTPSMLRLLSVEQLSVLSAEQMSAFGTAQWQAFTLEQRKYLDNPQVDQGTSKIVGSVWLDGDADGIWMDGEDGLAGISISLLNNKNEVVGRAVSASDGSYVFEGLAEGDYSVRFGDPKVGKTFTKAQAAGATSQNASQVVSEDGLTSILHLAAGHVLEGVNAGITDADGASVYGRLIQHQAGSTSVNEGVPSINVSLLDALGHIVSTTTTDALGKYKFEGLSSDTYRVVFDKADFPAGAVLSDGIDTDGLSSTFVLEAGERKIGLNASVTLPNITTAVSSDVSKPADIIEPSGFSEVLDPWRAPTSPYSAYGNQDRLTSMMYKYWTTTGWNGLQGKKTYFLEGQDDAKYQYDQGYNVLSQYFFASTALVGVAYSLNSAAVFSQDSSRIPAISSAVRSSLNALLDVGKLLGNTIRWSDLTNPANRPTDPAAAAQWDLTEGRVKDWSTNFSLGIAAVSTISGLYQIGMQSYSLSTSIAKGDQLDITSGAVNLVSSITGVASSMTKIASSVATIKGWSSSNSLGYAGSALGVVSGLASIASLAPVLARDDLSVTEKGVIAGEMSLQIGASAAAVGASILAARATAQGLSSGLSIAASGVLAGIAGVVASLSPMEIYAMIRQTEYADKLDSLGKTLGEFGYEGDSLMADFYREKTNMEAGIMAATTVVSITGTAVTLAMMSNPYSAAIGVVVGLVVGVVSGILKGVQQNIIEDIATRYAEKIRAEGGSYDYFSRSLQARFNSFVSEPEMRQYLSDVQSQYQADSVIGVYTSLLPTTALEFASITRNSANLATSAAYVARYVNGEREADNTLTIDPTIGRIELSGQAGNKQVLKFLSPLMAPGVETRTRIETGKKEYFTSLQIIFDSAQWSISDGAADSVLDVRKVVSRLYGSDGQIKANVTLAVDGGEGNDTLISGLSDTHFDGGSDQDTADYSAAGSVKVTVSDDGKITVLKSVHNPDVYSEVVASGDYYRGKDKESVQYRDIVLKKMDLDTFTAKDVLVNVETVVGSNGNDIMEGSIGADYFVGGKGNDILTGNDGDDTLFGGSGTDIIRSGNGNDRIVQDDNALGDDIDGGSGIDVVDYSLLTAGITVDLINARTTLNSPTATLTDTLKNVETIIGSAFNDVIRGDGAANTLYGNDGDDELWGYDGNDQLEGGVGKDLLQGGTGADLLEGGAGDDRLFGGDGDDSLVGGTGADILDGGAGSDTLIVEGADPLVSGGADDDYIYMRPQDIGLTNNGQHRIIDGGTGVDTLNVDAVPSGFEFGDTTRNMSEGISVDLGTGHLSLRSQDSGVYDELKGIEGVVGSIYNDLLTGSNGDDMLSGNAGNDVLHGAAGNDMLLGGPGEDLLYGDDGDDMLVGGDGVDMIWGGNGNDALNGEGGNDILNGGAGHDKFLMSGSFGQDIIVDSGDSHQGDEIAFIDLDPSQLWFSRENQDLRIGAIGRDDSVTVQSWFAKNDAQVGTISAGGKAVLAAQVNTLVEAMAAMHPPASGETTLPARYDGAVASAITSSWKYAS